MRTRRNTSKLRPHAQSGRHRHQGSGRERLVASTLTGMALLAASTSGSYVDLLTDDTG